MNTNFRNPFEKLRKPGVCGKVITAGYNIDTIYMNGAKAALQLRTAEMIPGVWGFGFILTLGETTREMFPGEGSGWFCSEKDAKLYALGYVRYGGVRLPEDMTYAIDVATSKLRNVSLFDE